LAEQLLNLESAKCDAFGDLVECLREESRSAKVGMVLILKNAEKLRDLDANLLPGFMRLQELTG